MTAPATHTNPRLGGLVLGSTDPQRLHDWYKAAFAPEAEPVQEEMPVLALELGGTWLIFERRDDVAERAAEPGRVLFNIEVDDIRAAEERLNGLGVTWIRPVSEPAPGEPVRLATVEDPDGNYPQIIEDLS
jgi:hypothetical protein